MTRRRRVGTQGEQAELPFKVNGGARKGSGRKRKAPRPSVPHRPRVRITAHVPALITVRLLPGLASLRRSAEHEVVRGALADSCRWRPFQVVHYSIQTNHLHLIAEAQDRPALSTGMKALLVRIARRLNRLWRRKGTVFAERYHSRALRTPLEVRHALVYVLHNARKHGIAYSGVDPCSSGAGFDGWSANSAQRQVTATDEGRPASRESQHWTVGARTWLLSIGWRRRGLIGLEECPSLKPGKPRTAGRSS